MKAENWSFAQHVVDEFRWLEDRGFVVSVIAAGLVHYDRDHVRVHVGFEERERAVDVLLGQLLKMPRVFRPYTLSEVSALPHVPRDEVITGWAARDEQSLVRGLCKISRFLRAYSGPLLTGDSATYEALAGIRTEINEEMQSRMTRIQAERASDAGRYGEALACYDSLGRRQTAADRRRIAQLKKLV